MRVFTGKLTKISQMKKLDVGVDASVLIDWNVHVDRKEKFPHGLTLSIADEQRYYRFDYIDDTAVFDFDDEPSLADFRELLTAAVNKGYKITNKEEIE